MAENTNTVTLAVQSYNQTKNENFRLNLFLDNIIKCARLSEDHQSLEFDTEKIEEAVKFCFGERYRKKLSTLKTQNTRYGVR